MATSPNKTADCDATTEASQSVIHSGALPPTAPAQFSIQETMLFVENEREATTAPAQFSIQETMLFVENERESTTVPAHFSIQNTMLLIENK